MAFFKDFLLNFRFKDYIQLLLITVLILIVFSIFFIFSNSFGKSTSYSITLIMVSLSILMALVSILSTFQRHPSSLLISMLGLSNSGKTVYLTMLFNEFMSKKIEGVFFSTYGSETAEEVSKNLNLLYAQKWLPPTRISSVFPFRAIASIDKGLNKKRFKIEIDDYAGEYSSELTEETWLHKSKYFEYVVKSDVIFITIDGEIILNAIKNNDFTKTHIIENSYITALKLIIEAKGVAIDRKMKTPVALIFTKCDLFYSFFEKIENLDPNGNSVSKWDGRHQFFLTNSMQRLIDFCNSNLSKNKIFFTTSLGKLNENNTLPSTFEPKNITQPIIWALYTVES